VRLRVREQLMQGASQIKLTAGGGVSSPFSPIDVTTFTEAELRAAVEAAENWGTFVATHAFTPAAIRRSIAAGVTMPRVQLESGRSRLRPHSVCCAPIAVVQPASTLPQKRTSDGWPAITGWVESGLCDGRL
jgi:hypothetical protein